MSQGVDSQRVAAEWQRTVGTNGGDDRPKIPQEIRAAANHFQPVAV
jgi:hypothetical protein